MSSRCDQNTFLENSFTYAPQSHPFFKGIDWENIHRYPAPYRPELVNPEDTRHFDSDIPPEVCMQL